MEINPPVTTNSSLPIPNPKSPDSDPNPIDQLPSTRIHSTKPTILTNGVLKRHTSPTNTTYKECRKNHAASIGGHALDGCGEFMPSPNSTPTDPTSLTCAACGCHRNFHRRDPDDSCTPTSTTTHVIEYHPQHRHHPLPPPPPSHHRARSPNNSPSPPPISSSYYPPPLHSHSAPHMLLALSEGGGGGNPHHHHPYRSPNLTPRNCNSEGRRSRKRFRTKFTQDQKDRMYEFAEKVGWKMQRSNDEMVAGFCNEVGVERGVLKVWMHNNKNTYGGKRDLNLMISSSNNNINLVSSSSGGGGGGGVATNLVGRSGVGGGIQLQPLLNHHLHQQNGNEDVSNSTDQSSGRENNNVGGNSSGIANSYSKNGVIHHSSNNNDGGGGGTNGSSSSS